MKASKKVKEMTPAEITKHFHTVDYIQSETKSETQEKFENSNYHYQNFCSYCGRGIKGEPKQYIVMIAPGYVLPNVIEGIEDIDAEITRLGLENYGAHPIGSECKKNYPKTHICVAK